MIRHATIDDIEAVKKTAQSCSREIGFVLRPALVQAVNRGELLFDPVSAGFCHYHTRKDGVTVIYEIAVPKEYRRRGIGKSMVEMLPRPIQLKCPVDNRSNGFYAHVGFDHLETVVGRKRPLHVWRLEDE